jgi:glycosyltransferase involved in cell wall biosynthesis
MKLLIVHNAHQKYGGDDAVVARHAKMLRALGHEVYTYMRHNDEISGYGFVRKVMFLFGIIYSIPNRRSLQDLLCRMRPDVIMIHNIYPLLSPSVYDSPRELNIPVIQVVNDMRFWCPNAWLFCHGAPCPCGINGNFARSVLKKCYRNSYILTAAFAFSLKIAWARGLFGKITAFFIPSPHIRPYLVRSGVDERRIIDTPHIVTVDATRPFRPRSYVAYLGRLSLEKGVHLIPGVASQMSEVTFQLAGTGPMEAALKNDVTSRNITNITFRGFLQPAAVADFLSGARVLVVPSLCLESFGQVVLEAYACGTPVLAANHGGLATLVEDHVTGRLFNPGDANDLMRCLSAMLKADCAERLGRQALQRYQERYSEKEVTKKWINEIVNVVEGKIAQV